MNGEKKEPGAAVLFAISKEFGISLLMWAFTVRSSMPSAAPISRFDRPPTRSSKTSLSRFEETAGLLPVTGLHTRQRERCPL